MADRGRMFVGRSPLLTVSFRGDTGPFSGLLASGEIPVPAIAQALRLLQ